MAVSRCFLNSKREAPPNVPFCCKNYTFGMVIWDGCPWSHNPSVPSMTSSRMSHPAVLAGSQGDHTESTVHHFELGPRPGIREAVHPLHSHVATSTVRQSQTQVIPQSPLFAFPQCKHAKRSSLVILCGLKDTPDNDIFQLQGSGHPTRRETTKRRGGEANMPSHNEVHTLRKHCEPLTMPVWGKKQNQNEILHILFGKCSLCPALGPKLLGGAMPPSGGLGRLVDCHK